MNSTKLIAVLCVLCLGMAFPFAGCHRPSEALNEARTADQTQKNDAEASEKAKSTEPQNQQSQNESESDVEVDPASQLRHEDLDAILWVRTSGEYQAIARQAYQSATVSVSNALLDPTWTACTEQQQMADEGAIQLADLPPAIVLDVDETVLDNSDYQISLIDSREEYNRETWKTFCKSKSSRAVPGAVDFLNRCRAAGVQILFLTNREAEVEAETRENLIAVGLMNKSDEDIIFCKHEMEDWKSSKITRRKFLAQKYRLLLLVGDDLHDFTDLGEHPTSGARQAIVTNNQSWWGTRWIVLPNPSYGGWEQSTYGYQHSSSSKTKLKLKTEALLSEENE